MCIEQPNQKLIKRSLSNRNEILGKRRMHSGPPLIHSQSSSNPDAYKIPSSQSYLDYIIEMRKLVARRLVAYSKGEVKLRDPGLFDLTAYDQPYRE